MKKFIDEWWFEFCLLAFIVGFMYLGIALQNPREERKKLIESKRSAWYATSIGLAKYHQEWQTLFVKHQEYFAKAIPVKFDISELSKLEFYRAKMDSITSIMDDLELQEINLKKNERAAWKEYDKVFPHDK